MAASGIFIDDEITGRAYDAALVRRLLGFVQPYARLAALAVGLLLALAGLELLGPLIGKVAVDRYIVPRDPSGLPLMAGAFVAVQLLSSALRYVQNLVTQMLGQRVMFDLRMRIFSHLQDMSLSFYDHNPVGRLVTRLTNDVDALNELLTSGAVAVFGDIFSLVTITIALLALNWQLGLISLCVMPLVYLTVRWFQTGMRQAYRDIRLRLAIINGYLNENITGMQVVQLFNRERRNFERFDQLNRDHLNANMRSIFYYALFYPVVELFMNICLALVIWFGGRQVLGDALTIGALTAFLTYVQRFFMPIRDLSEKYNILQAAMASSERIFKLLDHAPEVRDPEGLGSGVSGRVTTRPQTLDPKPGGRVEFRDVWFAYVDEEWVLKDVSFTIEPGETVAFVGATGAGKTSLLSLLSRFYDVQRGQVLLDGTDVREMPQRELRRRVGAVLQDPFLFSGTIASNIRLLDGAITDEQIRAAARAANAAEFIERLPLGYDTEIYERGAGLSMGQRQLIALARAIAFDPDVLLVLDEATANVDSETEGLIQEALQGFMAGRTGIIIAHRLSTIQYADRILVMHRGRLVEQGSHAELLRLNGIYRRLWELQAIEERAPVA
ncbi:MAG TPA: ABC transporter ATP-binding protein [Chloroflexota bacterium]|nr:ABC transporter ATP-binding protein [Chloroflexota bacterium]